MRKLFFLSPCVPFSWREAPCMRAGEQLYALFSSCKTTVIFRFSSTASDASSGDLVAAVCAVSWKLGNGGFKDFFHFPGKISVRISGILSSRMLMNIKVRSPRASCLNLNFISGALSTDWRRMTLVQTEVGLGVVSYNPSVFSPCWKLHRSSLAQDPWWLCIPRTMRTLAFGLAASAAGKVQAQLVFPPCSVT